ncbi:uncharacterized protein SETTUDRAFT_174842 [Exserohilum turcica Et28A]|uniref:Uncharacterized protein n=1 Tax=Exserohilum turcicum (strain 28A) TaxID=671987 RepID=R0J151_EXST2|nr:uncharacterized protein SETTUDRAFT_174842 [Exserohilum turcica Et28A]EOA90660.1 hypothetical protein SETTUDRAFT_174842 [Exserohilum turcica Et28A]
MHAFHQGPDMVVVVVVCTPQDPRMHKSSWCWYWCWFHSPLPHPHPAPCFTLPAAPPPSHPARKQIEAWTI